MPLVSTHLCLQSPCYDVVGQHLAMIVGQHLAMIVGQHLVMIVGQHLAMIVGQQTAYSPNLIDGASH